LRKKRKFTNNNNHNNHNNFAQKCRNKSYSPTQLSVFVLWSSVQIEHFTTFTCHCCSAFINSRKRWVREEICICAAYWSFGLWKFSLIFEITFERIKKKVLKKKCFSMYNLFIFPKKKFVTFGKITINFFFK